MASNEIRDVTFRPLAPDADQPGHALFIALELAAPGQLLGFLEDVISRFKRERMTGPADAHAMLITITGDVSAADFARAWQAAIANDPPARALLGMLQQADVLEDTARGHALGKTSLLAA